MAGVTIGSHVNKHTIDAIVEVESRSGANLYDRDFYAWTNQQAELLRARKLSEADLEHIAEEIERLGKTEKR